MGCKTDKIAKVGSGIVKTNIYRCLEFCPNCPFLDEGKSIGLKRERLSSIKEKLISDDQESFSCHKTVYDLNNNMEHTEKQSPKMCYGAYKYLKKKNKPNIMMRLALSMGIDKESE